MKTTAPRLSTLLVIATLLFGILAYAWMIYSQCGSTSLVSFTADFRAFHTRDGC